MKAILIACIFLLNILHAEKIDRHEINIKVASYVKHYKNYGFDWNEGWNNRAKGIEYLYSLDETHSLGLTYLNMRNSTFDKTIAKGFVYKYSFNPFPFDIKPNTKFYYLHQKGYCGKWYELTQCTSNTKNEFWTPLLSVGASWQGFTVDIVGSKDLLHAVAFGYGWRF